MAPKLPGHYGRDVEEDSSAVLKMYEDKVEWENRGPGGGFLFGNDRVLEESELP